VTHRADAESLNFIRRARRENPSAKVVVTGCLTELDSARIRRAEARSLIVKNKNKSDILRHLSSRFSLPCVPDVLRLPKGISGFKGHTRAFLKIQDGCDHFCSYCKVPLVRGRSRSRPLREVVREAGVLAKGGFKEIVLCGICLGAYGRDLKPRNNLVDVIGALEKIDGLLRIRVSSIEAGDVSPALIDKMSAPGKLCRHLHIPVQSGDNDILRRMRRGFSRADYSRLFKTIKARIPGIAVTTDIMVGFPGESQNNFQNSVSLIREIEPLKTHIFPYSRRRHTAAAKDALPEICPQTIKRRASYLRAVAQTCAFSFKKRFLGRHLHVLIEGKCAGDPDFWQGHSDNYLKVRVASELDLENRIVRVSLKNIKAGYILARPLGNSAKG
jgi:threonylcarbamoyladenosine tRNA methylthiotransferase MtaB